MEFIKKIWKGIKKLFSKTETKAIVHDNNIHQTVSGGNNTVIGIQNNEDYKNE